MVDVDLTNEPTSKDLNGFIDRIQSTDTFPRGLTAGRLLSYDAGIDTLSIDFTQLKRVLLEHEMYEQAKGFSATRIDLLRVLEEGPDRMRFDEIKDTLNSYYEEQNGDALEDSTIQHYLRDLREKGLVDHQFNSYTYVGP